MQKETELPGDMLSEKRLSTSDEEERKGKIMGKDLTIPQYTAEEYYSSSAPYEWLYAHREDKFLMKQLTQLTRASGLWSDGEPQIVLARHDGPFAEILQEALRKLARFEDEEEKREST